MTIKTKPAFYFIDAVTAQNNLLNFIEPTQDNIELTASVEVGGRSIEKLMTNITRAMNDAGKNTYTVVFDRDTRLVTISGDGDFDLLIDTGSNSGLSIFSLIGFNGADLTGLATYTGDSVIGGVYLPQFFPQSYKDNANNVEGINASVNESAEGIVEVITFGDRSFIEMNLKYITNRKQGKGGSLDNNPNAVEQANEFLQFCIKKNELEIMKDRDDRNSFFTILLERTRASSDGVSYELRELISQGLDEYYETGTLRFRVV